MTATPCAIDRRPTQDGYVCQGCCSRAAGHLAAIVDLAPDARLVAAGLVRRGGGGSGGKPGSQSPINDGATDVVDAVQNALTTLARHVAETRGLQRPSAPLGVRMLPDPLVRAAEELSVSLEWLRHAVDDQGEPYAVHAFEEISRCTTRLRGMVNGREPGRYAGPCGYVDEGGELCGEDVEARPGSNYATCRACGSRYDVEERQAWMRGEIEDHLARPVEIASVLMRLGFPIGYSTIAAYASKGQLVPHGHDQKERPLYRIGDVLDLRMAATKTPRRRLQPPRDMANPAGG